MSKIQIMRTDLELPASMETLSNLLFRCIDGFTKDDRRAWRRFWKQVIGMEPGELARFETVFPRDGVFHRRHMKMEQTFFDSQEKFDNFRQFRNWLKVGAGHCDWMPGPKGAVVPIPKSIDYASMDDEELKVCHDAMIAFLRTPHAGKVLWKHLSEQGRADMVETLLRGFE